MHPKIVDGSTFPPGTFPIMIFAIPLIAMIVFVAIVIPVASLLYLE